MFVKERMNKNAVSVRENISPAKAIVIMKESRHRRLPVVNEQNVPVGIIDQHNIEMLGTAGSFFSGTKVSDVMNTNFFKINENTLIEDCALTMKDNKTAFLPVVDNDNVLTGVITSYDVLKGLMKLMDIRGEGFRLVVKSNDIAGIANIVSRNGKIRSIITDNDTTIVKFDSSDGNDVKERVNAQYNVLYFKEQ